jgi:hypothetical protein
MKMKTYTLAAIAAFLPVLAAAQDAPDSEAAAAETLAEPVVISTIATSQLEQEEGFVPFKCPIEKIRNAYSNLVNPEDTLVALAIEKQTLAICRQSQRALITIAENEMRLKELFQPIIAPMAPPAPETAQDAIDQIAALPGPDTAPRTLPASDPITMPEPIEDLELEDIDIEIVEDVEPEPVIVPPPYNLAAVMKDPMGWKAMLVDGNAIFTVRPGDKMDDGSRVVSIERGVVELLKAGNTHFLE